MGIETILAGLDKVSGRDDQYKARCPAHDDRSPSLTITETADGKVLMHCFSGCAVEDIVAALGLEMTDLFPPSDLDSSVRKLHAIQKSQGAIEAALHHELVVLTIILGNRIADRKLAKDSKFREQRPGWCPTPHAHWEREIEAASRCRTALEVLYG